MTVFCLMEVDDGGVVDASLRALTLARGVAAQAGDGLAAVVFGEPPADDLAAYGVDDVYAVSGIDGYAPQAWGRALAALADGASAVVAAGTDRGNEVLAHVGAITGLPMAANCVAVSAGSGGSFEIVRQRWAGLLLEEAVLDAPMALLTAATDAGTAAPADAPGSAVVHQVAASPPTATSWCAPPRRLQARAVPHWLARAWSSAAVAGSAAPTGSGRWTSSRRSSAAWSGSRGW